MEGISESPKMGIIEVQDLRKRIDGKDVIMKEEIEKKISWTTASFQIEKAHKVIGRIQEKRNKPDHILVKCLNPRD